VHFVSESPDVFQKQVNLQSMSEMMTRVVMMTLARWDDRGEEMNQEEADQDVPDEVSEEVD